MRGSFLVWFLGHGWINHLTFGVYILTGRATTASSTSSPCPSPSAWPAGASGAQFRIFASGHSQGAWVLSPTQLSDPNKHNRYLVYPEAIHQALRSLQDTMPTHCSIASQVVAAAALDPTGGGGGSEVGPCVESIPLVRKTFHAY